MGHATANLHLSKKIPVLSEKLHMEVKDLFIQFIKRFKILLDIPSYPVEFLNSRDITVYLISTSETEITFISVILSNVIFLKSNDAI